MRILTLGPWVGAWIEQNLVHGPGDQVGDQFRLTPEQKKLLGALYAIDEDGNRKVNRAVIGRSKGWGKTEFTAAIAVAEFAGPVRFGGWRDDGSPIAVPQKSPDIPVAAASFDQAEEVYGAAKVMVAGTDDGDGVAALAPFVDVFDREMEFKDGRPGRLYRVAAVAGTNDGPKQTFAVCDETHEWRDAKRRVHLVLTNGVTKRRGWSVEITTAGFDGDGSIAEDAYKLGKRVESGEVDQPGLFFDWAEAPEDLDPTDPEQRREMILAANPNAELFGVVDRYVARFNEVPVSEWLRYYANRWTASAEQWLPPGVWEGLEDPRDLEGEVVLGFSSVTGDQHSAGLVALDSSGHVRVLANWEQPEQKHYTVPEGEVTKAIDEAFDTYDVRELHCYPSGWKPEWDEWVDRYGEHRVTETPVRSMKLQAQAAARFYRAAMAGDISHDGDPRLDRHLKTANTVDDAEGVYLTHKGASGSINLARAAVLAFNRDAETVVKKEPMAVWI